MKKISLTIACAAALLAITGCQNHTPVPTKAEKDSAYALLSDEEKRLAKNALAGLEVADGLEATLFASEPMIGNPTNIDVDAKGRVWMCEAFNYRPQLNPDNPQRPEGDRILILEDTNGDSKADTAKVFYQGTDVNAALGVAVLGNKVIVSCSPNVFVFTDTDGDDKPDSKEVLFSHVGGEQHDHAIHSFSFGPDGKLYFNFGNAGEQLMDKNGNPLKDKEGKVINDKGSPYRQGMVFRMNPDGSEIEVLAHNFRNNYEAAVDAFGTIWQSDNDDDGNQGVRINYVMEYGNYGYTDEMTGAGWQAQRTNMEPQIPQRHWHQNDPGSIPNLLFTGAGSPTGMVVYEGDLLPEQFHNQMIHCDAGPNVVRSYPVQKEGAGYKASIVPLLEGVRDQWFRPSDVCVAPDGSLFVADWYDPGVGGHQMGDLNRGRIYRIAPPRASYKIPAQNLETPEGAAAALKSPNLATRYLAWQKLHGWGQQAETALLNLWKSDNPRFRARALWLLAKMEGKGEAYIQQGLKDADTDIRITALRAARQTAPDVIPYVKQLVNDKEPQVRREAAIALRHNQSPQAAAVWTELALQHDGKDRWYLEALGIGADGQWDAFLTAYKEKAGTQLNTPAGRDLVWRSRTPQALPLLAAGIEDEGTAPADRLKYFRAFDFIDAPDEKEAVLLALLENKGPYKSEITQTALSHLEPSSMARSPKVKAALNQTLAGLKNEQEFINLVRRYKVKDQHKRLLGIALTQPDSTTGVQAAGLLVQLGGSRLLKQTINGNDQQKAQAALTALSHTGSKEALSIMQSVMTDRSVDLAVRQEAVRLMAGGWMESEYLLNIIKNGKLSSDLKPTAAVALSGTYRKDIRQEALKYLSTAKGKGGELPTISELAKQSGNAAAGKQVFQNTCSTCHKAGDEGAQFGPALTQIGSKLPKEALYMAILHPDAGISFGYEGYLFKLKDGSTVAGIISSETETELEVLLPGGIKKKYEKSQVASRKEMETSMMPSNLQQAMTKEELVNLVEYLSLLKSPGDGRVAQN